MFVHGCTLGFMHLLAMGVAEVGGPTN
uniref:Uncharacterized protein n=1 Tax=Anguilla anguilla TaxID=7936 RepID=A0A0E9P7P4_ANGAN